MDRCFNICITTDPAAWRYSAAGAACSLKARPRSSFLALCTSFSELAGEVMSHPVWVTRLGLGAATYASRLSFLVTVTKLTELGGHVQLDGIILE